ncbi:MAG: hypothetical protein PHP86_17880 [Nevskiales bacterium]|nr:hypothetical protein [Nevskiales bacterium]
MISGKFIPIFGALALLLSGCSDESSGGSNVFSMVAAAYSGTTLQGIEHQSETAYSINSRTTCVQPVTAPDEEALRSTYTRDGSAICIEDADQKSCLRGQDLGDAQILHLVVGESYEITISFANHLHRWTFQEDPQGGARGFMSIGSRDTSDCDPAGTYEYTYTASDLDGDFEAVAFDSGSMTEWSRDAVRCAGETCTGQAGRITLALPAASFDSQSFQGYVQSGSTAQIEGTLYGQILGNVAPSKDRGSFLVCPDSATWADAVEQCVFLALERVP